MAIFCSRETRDLATVQYTGFNHCEVLDLIKLMHYWAMHTPDGELELIWRVTEDSPLQKSFVPVGSIVIETRRGGINVLTEAEYDRLYIGCC